MASEAFLQSTYEARDGFLRQLGQVNPDVLAPLMNPSFMGGPMWPDLRQAWHVVVRDRSTLIVSDGLSDPFSDDEVPGAGFGLEVLAESADVLPEQLQTSWLFELVYLVSQQCAHHGGVRELIDEVGLISLELPSSPVFQPVATLNETAGVLLGVAPPDFPITFDLPGGSVRIVTAKLLWPRELDFIIERGEAGRKELADRIAADGSHHCSSLNRKPVV